MIREFSIKNYRKIKNLDLQDLSTINIFVGENSVGKSSILEALNIGLSGHPNIHQRIARFRNLNDFQSALAGLFNNNQIDIPIEFSYGTSKNQTVTLKIEALHRNDLLKLISKSMALSQPDNKGVLEVKESRETVFGGSSREQIFGVTHTQKNSLDAEERTWQLALDYLTQENPNFVNFSTFHIHGMKGNSVGETIRMISEIGGDFELEADLFKALRTLEPNLHRLRVSQPYGRPEPNIEVDMNNKTTFPIQLMGDGFNRLTLMLTGAYHMNSKFLFVDEIDSGLHYSAMESIWETLVAIATEQNKQIFCTTHSEEMLASTLASFAGQEDHLRIFRVYQDDDLMHQTQKYNYQLFEVTSYAGLETR